MNYFDNSLNFKILRIRLIKSNILIIFQNVISSGTYKGEKRKKDFVPLVARLSYIFKTH